MDGATRISEARAAIERGDLDAAVADWRQLVDGGGPPGLLPEVANALLALGRVAEAEEAFHLLSRRRPQLPLGMLGIVRCAGRRGDHDAVIAGLDQCLESFPRHPKAEEWRAKRATALFRADRLEESEAAFRAVLARTPQDQRAVLGLARCLVERSRIDGRYGERRDELIAALDDVLDGGDEDARFVALGLLARSGEVARLRRRIVEVAKVAESPEAIARCLRIMPLAVDPGGRGALWAGLLSRIEGRAEGLKPDRAAVAAAAELGLLLALGERSRFVARQAEVDGLLDAPTAMLARRAAERLSAPADTVFGEAKVFCIGLSKTGTSSIAEALTRLGYDTGHWSHPLTHQLIGDFEVHLLGAVADITVACRFEQLYYQYPNARFILTERPLADWRASYLDHYGREMWAPTMAAIKERGRALDDFGYLFDSLAAHYGLVLHHDDPVAAYAAHQRRVGQFFADKEPGKLLRFDVFSGDGWPELCRFLDRPEPAAAFPWANRARVRAPAAE